MDEPKFLGVYSGHLETYSRKRIKGKKQFWFVWFMDREHRYLVLNIDEEQEIPPYYLSLYQFDSIFKAADNLNLPQPECPNRDDVEFYSRTTTSNTQNPFEQISSISSLPQTKNSPHQITEVEQKLNPNDSIKKEVVTKKETELDTIFKELENVENLNYTAELKTQVYPSQAEYVKNNSYNPDFYQHYNFTGIPNRKEEHETQHLLLPKTCAEQKRENLLAMRIDNEIRRTLEDAIEIWQEGKKGVATIKLQYLLKKDFEYVKAHKHTFTECAIQLRKIHEWDLALSFALRCVEVSPDDSHVYFNVARIYFEEHEYKLALEYIKKSLELDFCLEHAHRLSAAILKAMTKKIATA